MLSIWLPGTYSPNSITSYLCAHPSLVHAKTPTPVNAALCALYFIQAPPLPYLRMSHSLSPSSPDLRDFMLGFQSLLDHLGEWILALEAAQAHIGSVSVSMMLTPSQPPSTTTKGKMRAEATPAPSKAKLAKKECPTKKASPSISCRSAPCDHRHSGCDGGPHYWARR